MHPWLCFFSGARRPVLFPAELIPSQALTTVSLFFFFYLHPKAVFTKIWSFPPSWLETSDPHGHICMDLHLKANQGTNSLPIFPRWGLNCEQEAQMKDKNERWDRWWASVVEGEQQPRCQHRQITEQQRTCTRIPAVFNQTGSLLPMLQPGLFCCCCRLINAVFLRHSDVDKVCLITNLVFEGKWEFRKNDSRGFNTFHHLRGVTRRNKDAFKSNVSGLKFNDPETVCLFVRNNWHIPAVPHSHYKLIYIRNATKSVCNKHTGEENEQGYQQHR